MLEFLKQLMNYKKSISLDERNTTHRILNTDIQKEPNEQEDSIIFGCGCFWGAEKCFWKLPGIITTSVGYAGGNKNNPSYMKFVLELLIMQRWLKLFGMLMKLILVIY